MDTLTHALSGALIGRAVAPGVRGSVSARDCVALGALAAAFPDADVVISLASPLAYLYHHRGVTHSLLLLPLWAYFIAWIWSRLRRNRAGLRAYFLVSLLGVGGHILGDLITSFGTMIFAPLSDARVQWGTTFIIDLWFTGIIVAGLIAAWIFRGSRLPAITALAVLCAYVGFQWTQHERAIAFGNAYALERGIHSAGVSALPRPVSPFNWMVIVAEPERYHYAFVNLHRVEAHHVGSDAGFIAKLDSHYLPVGQARWQSTAKLGEGADRALGEEAWRQDRFAFYRWFAAYPVVAQIERGNPSQCVWFKDLRFLTPGRDSWPFRYGMCRGEDGEWQAFEHAQDDRRIRVTDGSPLSPYSP